MLGLTQADFAEDDVFWVWPDNAEIVYVFVASANQWRVGPAGPYALDYTALAETLRMMAIPRGEWPDLFNGIRVMESAALKEMRAA